MTKKDNIPAHLSVKMKKLYEKIIADYDLLEDHHKALLLSACELLDRAEQARLQIEKDGLTTSDRYNTVKIHPCCKLEIDAKNSARLLLRELGLNFEIKE